MKLVITLASALALHAAAAVGATALGVFHGAANDGATHARHAETIEIEATTVQDAPQIHEDVPVTTVAAVAHEASRGAQNPVQVLVRSASATSTDSHDVVPDPIPTAPPETHFKMSAAAHVGTPNGNAASPAVDAVADAIPDDAVTVRAQKIGGAQPAYPPNAIAGGVELGAPLPFEIVVDTSGRVASVRSLHHAGYGFDEAATTALRTFRFSPATRDGHPVNVRMRWTVEFKLD